MVYVQALVFLLLCALISPAVCNPTSTDKQVAQLSAKIAKFSTSLQNAVAEEKSNENIVMSPLSVEVLLALLSLGAEGKTHDELLKALDLPNDTFTRSSFKALTDQFKDVKGVTLNMANKVYVKEGGYPLKTDFERDSVDVFDAGIEALDFLNGAESANAVNAWVESKTNKRIQNILSAAVFNDKTRLVLVNAIYFKGSWKLKFHEELTTERDFKTSTGSTVQVPTMSAKSTFRYSWSDEAEAQFLELPYEGGEMSMVFVLPVKAGGLPELQAKLANDVNLPELLANMQEVMVDVKIPKFRIETSINLKQSLPKVGIERIFDENNAQLTKLLVTPERLYVSEAVQKAFIEVNEEGAEAAAATAFVIELESVDYVMEPEIFEADRPFMFYLMNKDVVLFTGSVNTFD